MYHPRSGDVVHFRGTYGDNDTDYHVTKADMYGVSCTAEFDDLTHDYVMSWTLFYELGPSLVTAITKREIIELGRVFHWAKLDIMRVVNQATVIEALWGESLAENFLPLVRIQDYAEMVTELTDVLDHLTETGGRL